MTTTPTARPHPRLGLVVLVLAFLLLAAGCTHLPSGFERPASHALTSPQDTPLGQLAERRRPDTAHASQSGFALLPAPDKAFAARLALVQQARQTLDLQYYLIHADASAERLLASVRKAAERGVRVRILLDDLHAVGRDALVMAMAQIPGVSLRMVNPLPGSRKLGPLRTLRALTDFDRIQRRMHNKLLVADNAWAITGGRNLGDAYFGADPDRGYVDVDVLAAGPVVRKLSAGFDRYWNDAVAYPAQALITPTELQVLKDTTQPRSTSATAPDTLPPALDLSGQELQWAKVEMLVDPPAKLVPGRPSADEAPATDAVMQGVLALMDGARHDVLIVTPYFVPGTQMMQAFARLRARDLPVRVLTNSLSSTTALLAHVGYAKHRRELLRLGVRLHEMHATERARLRHSLRPGDAASVPDSLHAKLLMIDGQTIVVGSMNMDQRSKLQNTEVALVIHSPALTEQATRQVDAAIGSIAWTLELAADGSLRWRAPADAGFDDASHEPDASFWLRVLAALLQPLVPEDLL